MARNYPTDLSGEEWELLKPELCAEGQRRRRGRVASAETVHDALESLDQERAAGANQPAADRAAT